MLGFTIKKIIGSLLAPLPIIITLLICSIFFSKYIHLKKTASILILISTIGLYALSNSAVATLLAPIVTGMNMTKELLERTIIKFGVAILSPEVGSVFDPALHEAMSMQPCPGMESNKIVKVLDKGYQLNGRVLRAAMVVVSS